MSMPNCREGEAGRHTEIAYAFQILLKIVWSFTVLLLFLYCLHKRVAVLMQRFFSMLYHDCFNWVNSYSVNQCNYKQLPHISSANIPRYAPKTLLVRRQTFQSISSPPFACPEQIAKVFLSGLIDCHSLLCTCSGGGVDPATYILCSQ